jgi:MFS family permease
VLLAGTIGGGIAGLLFGWSKTLPMLLFARCLAGVFSGTLTVGNTVLGDITDSSNQSIAFPIYGLVWPLGAIIGPLLGGSFANPATQWPTVFTGTFWQEYPYFLPGAIACLVSIIAVVVGWVTLKEVCTITVLLPAAY